MKNKTIRYLLMIIGMVMIFLGSYRYEKILEETKILNKNILSDTTYINKYNKCVDIYASDTLTENQLIKLENYIEHESEKVDIKIDSLKKHKLPLLSKKLTELIHGTDLYIIIFGILICGLSFTFNKN
jgi:hypothetical protein